MTAARHPTASIADLAVPRRLAGSAQAASLGRLVRTRLHDRRFWQVQALVGGATAAHYGVEIAGYTSVEGTFHGFAITLYIVPLLYAALSFGWEGAVMTALWGTALTSPSTWIWHHSALHWLAEVGQLGITMAIGILVAWRVDRESRQRQIAEELAARVTRLNQRLTSAQEEEWRRIARELHDDTAQSLILLCQQIDRAAAAPRLPRTSRDELRGVRTTAQAILKDVRRFSRDLRPSALDDLGLAAAVQWLASDISAQQGIETSVDLATQLPRLAADTELGIFRIIQEGLRNVAKHSGAARATVTLECRAGVLRIVVADNGRGFQPASSADDLVLDGKLGLVGMQERAQIMGGNLRVDSRPGGGTSLIISIPVKHEPSTGSGGG